MVRRRSTVRFRKGAPAQRHISNGGYELRGLVQARAAFPELTFVDPLSGGGLSADAAEFVIDDRLGVALRASWFYRGECLLSTELTKVTETVDDQVFQVEPSPGTRVITSRNPLAVVTAKDAVASAWMITTDLVKWISRPQAEDPD